MVHDVPGPLRPREVYEAELPDDRPRGCPRRLGAPECVERDLAHRVRARRRLVLEGGLCAPLLAARADVVEELLRRRRGDRLEAADVDVARVVLAHEELRAAVEEVVDAVPRDLEEAQAHLEAPGCGPVVLPAVGALEVGCEGKDVCGGVGLDARHRVRLAAPRLPVGEAGGHAAAEDGGLDEGPHHGVVDGGGVALVAKGVVEGELGGLDGLGVVDALAGLVDVEAGVADRDAVDGAVENTACAVAGFLVLAVGYGSLAGTDGNAGSSLANVLLGGRAVVWTLSELLN